MKISYLALLISLLAAPAYANLDSCKQLHAITPQVLSDLNQVGSVDYEKDHPGFGYSVSFADPTSKVTVFFYDYQHEVIPPEMALESFRKSARDIRAVAEKRGAELGAFNAYEMRDASQLLPLRAEAESSDGLAEVLALGVVDNCIVKLRFTGQFPLDEAKVWVKVITRYLNAGLSEKT